MNSDALDLIIEAVDKAGYTNRIGIAMDVAASEFWNNDLKKYDLGRLTNNNKNRVYIINH